MTDDAVRDDVTRHSTAELLIGVRKGDRAAREALADRYGRILRRLAHGRLPASARDRYETEELAQDTVLRGIAKAEQFEHRGAGAFLGYLRQILLNLIRDEVRRAARRPDRVEIEDRLPDPAPTPLGKLISRDVMRRYETALATLPDDQQEVVQLRLEGYSFNDVAHLTGKPSADAARMQYKRGMQRIAEHMQEEAPPG
jgi:RNA polymerase sigma-70 factor (ECF subfamily)